MTPSSQSNATCDIELIERLVVDTLHRDSISPDVAEARGGPLAAAIQRLRVAYMTGEIPKIRASLAIYFDPLVDPAATPHKI